MFLKLLSSNPPGKVLSHASQKEPEQCACAENQIECDRQPPDVPVNAGANDMLTTGKNIIFTVSPTISVTHDLSQPTPTITLYTSYHTQQINIYSSPTPAHNITPPISIYTFNQYIHHHHTHSISILTTGNKICDSRPGPGATPGATFVFNGSTLDDRGHSGTT